MPTAKIPRRSTPRNFQTGSQPQVKCPTCKKSGAWFAGKYGPFCSHRCKLIDLGKWLGGEHAISEPLKPEHFETFVDLPLGDYLDKPET